MDIKKVDEKFQISYLPSYTLLKHPHKVDCILDHMEESHEMHLVLHVLENCAYNPDQNQALVLF